MTGRERPPRRPRPPREPKGFTPDAVLSEEEVQRRVELQGGGAPLPPPPPEARFRDRRPSRDRKPERAGARDSLLLIGLAVVGIVAVTVLLPGGPLSASASLPPSDAATAAAAGPSSQASGAPSTVATAAPVHITLPPGSPEPVTEPPATEPPPTGAPSTKAPQATATPRPAVTPRPTVKPTAKPSASPSPTTGFATVTVTLVVVNNTTGSGASPSDWQVRILGEAAPFAVPNSFPGTDGGRVVTIPAGLGYRVADDASVPGYAGPTGTFDCFRAKDGPGLTAGQSYTCTITRNDRPHVIVKTVINGGSATPSDVAVTVSGGGLNPSSFNGSAAGVDVMVSADVAYSVSQSDLPGYAKSSSGSCSTTLGIDDPQQTCTFTYDESAPVSTGLEAQQLALLAAVAAVGLRGRRRWTAIPIR